MRYQGTMASDLRRAPDAVLAIAAAIGLTVLDVYFLIANQIAH
jgi:hypothetical protein